MEIKQNHRFQPGTLIKCRKRLWRVDSQEENILHVTAVDESTKHVKIFWPIEGIKPGNLPKPPLIKLVHTKHKN